MYGKSRKIGANNFKCLRSKKSKALNSKAKFIYVNSIFTIVQYILVLNIQYKYLPAAVEGSVITDCCVERFVDCCAVEGISVERFADAVFLGDTCLKAVVTGLLLEI